MPPRGLVVHGAVSCACSSRERIVSQPLTRGKPLRGTMQRIPRFVRESQGTRGIAARSVAGSYPTPRRRESQPPADEPSRAAAPCAPLSTVSACRWPTRRALAHQQRSARRNGERCAEGQTQRLRPTGTTRDPRRVSVCPRSPPDWDSHPTPSSESMAVDAAPRAPWGASAGPARPTSDHRCLRSRSPWNQWLGAPRPISENRVRRLALP